MIWSVPERAYTRNGICSAAINAPSAVWAKPCATTPSCTRGPAVSENGSWTGPTCNHVIGLEVTVEGAESCAGTCPPPGAAVRSPPWLRVATTTTTAMTMASTPTTMAISAMRWPRR